MKHPLLTGLLWLLAYATTYAQLPADPTTGKIVYTGALPLPANVTAAQAFGRSKIWLSRAFLDHDVPVEDAASGLLSSAGVTKVNNLSFPFRIRLQVEGAQVKYRLDDFQCDWLNLIDGTSTHGTAEAVRDSKMIGKGGRAKALAKMDSQIREGLAQLGSELAGSL